MKKTAAGAALTVAIGFSALTAAPATASHLPFPNCATAEAAGVYNIPAGTPGYGPHLDRDGDGFGCDQSPIPYDAAKVQQLVNLHGPLPPEPPPIADPPPAVEPPTEPGPAVPLPGDPQMEQMPVGAVDAGVSVNESTHTGVLALAGGLALAGTAGATATVRRRNAQA